MSSLRSPRSVAAESVASEGRTARARDKAMTALSSKATTTTGASTSSSASATTTTAGAAATGSATVTTAQTSLGKILVDSKGMTLYVWDNDKTMGTSSCTGACATAWPPLMATASPTYGAGLTAAMFSTITRSDGTKQIAVNGKQLYHWV